MGLILISRFHARQKLVGDNEKGFNLHHVYDIYCKYVYCKYVCIYIKIWKKIRQIWDKLQVSNSSAHASKRLNRFLNSSLDLS